MKIEATESSEWQRTHLENVFTPLELNLSALVNIFQDTFTLRKVLVNFRFENG